MTGAGVPAEERDTRRRCRATSKSTGNRCGNYAIKGATVCRMHGGSAPQVRRAARARLAALVDPAIDALTKVLEEHTDDDVVYDDKGRPHLIGPTFTERIKAAEAILDRAGYPKRTEIDLGDSVERIRDRIRAIREGEIE